MSSESATSFTGATAGAGVSRSALGVGRGVGSPQGVMVVEVLSSTDFVAKGEGTSEFISPAVSERGGTEIHASSFSLGIMMG